MPTPALDVAFARRFFPALREDLALFDNAGGSLVPRTVVDRVADYMRTCFVQLEADYALSVEATRRVVEGQRCLAELVNADPEEVVVGSSTTMNVRTLAHALSRTWGPGDAVVVTDLDHEANIGAWRAAAEARGAEVRTWRVRPETYRLEAEDLAALLDDRVRLVAFTHCSNLVGAFHDVASLARMVRDAGALSCVDGVAFAPHRRVDVRALGVDFYVLSLYKVYGPHQGLLFAKREHLLALEGPNHFFIPREDLPYKWQPGAVPHELAAGLPGILEYLDALDAHHHPGAQDPGARLDRAFEVVAAHEERLCAPLLGYLAARPDVRVIGPTTADRAVRAPTVSFVVDGVDSATIPPKLAERGVATRAGHCYAHRAATALDLHARGGVVRASMVHYNTAEEVERLVAALDAVLP